MFFFLQISSFDFAKLMVLKAINTQLTALLSTNKQK